VEGELAKRITKTLRTALALAIIAAPLLVYVNVFGFSVSNNHTRWGEFGSAMSGIHSPVITVLALLVLVGQARAQNQLNTHQFDQSYIAEARSDLHYFLEHLSRALNSEARAPTSDGPTGVTVREFLHAGFQPSGPSSLSAPELLGAARTLHARHPDLFATWSAIFPVLAGLNATTRYPYTHNAVAANLKISTILSFETCVCLDNYHWCLTEGASRVQYAFSKGLPANPAV
jgi:hypothetical protein